VLKVAIAPVNIDRCLSETGWLERLWPRAKGIGRAFWLLGLDVDVSVLLARQRWTSCLTQPIQLLLEWRREAACCSAEVFENFRADAPAPVEVDLFQTRLKREDITKTSPIAALKSALSPDRVKSFLLRRVR
jgi:hypothetical protein